MIDYYKAYILFEVKATIPFVNGDDANNNKIDIVNFGEFDIQLSYKNPFIFKRNTSTFNVVSAYLYVNEIKLN